MNRVWFVYKIIESILGLCCLGYHARGFLNINYIQDHYVYVSIFGGFSLMSMFGCLSVCLKERVSPLREGCLSLIAAIAFILVSINSMYHAEKNFYLMYLSADVRGEIEGNYREEFDLTHEPHPFFKYSKAQSVAALICGSLYLLHAILAFDLAVVEINATTDVGDGDTAAGEEMNQRLSYYVFGKKVHSWLNRFDWFATLAIANNIGAGGELFEVHLPGN